MNKTIYEDMKCPKCKCMQSEIWGHSLINTDRKCLACGFIYNRGINQEALHRIRNGGIL